jgi:AraC-like DNA-binding protein
LSRGGYQPARRQERARQTRRAILKVTRQLNDWLGVHWAELAVELGYADQAHLTRDFAAIFGEPPTRHAERYPS